MPRTPTWDDLARALSSFAPEVIDEVSRRAAVAVVLRDTPEGVEMLFIRRAEHPEDPWSGHMAFPGGRAEPEDPDLYTTAVRETREEIGIDLETSATLLGTLATVRAMARAVPLDLSIKPFVFRLEDPARPVLSDEVTSVHWIPLEVLFAPASLSLLDVPHDGDRLQLPCFRVVAVSGGELVIWGLTYRMCRVLGDLTGVRRGDAL